MIDYSGWLADADDDLLHATTRDLARLVLQARTPTSKRNYQHRLDQCYAEWLRRGQPKGHDAACAEAIRERRENDRANAKALAELNRRGT